MIAERGEDPIGILVGHEPTADLGMGLRRNDRLAPLALEAGPHPVDVECRSGAAALERRKADLADEGRQPEVGQVGVLVERQGGDGRLLSLGQGNDVVIEAWNADPAVGALERGDDLGKGVGRILDGTAVAARVKVDGRSHDVDLGVHEAAQGNRDRGQIALEEARVTDDREVGGQPLALGVEPAIQVGAARLLLAFEDELEVDRQLAAGGKKRLRCPEVEMQLALVVRRAPADDPVSIDDRLERR